MSRRPPTVGHLLTAALISAVVLRAFLWPVSPNDFWWQLATGRLIVEGGAIPTVDVFSYTRAGASWYDQPWLAQLAMYGLFRFGGVPLLVLFQALTLAFTFGLLLRLSIVRSGRPGLSAALLLLTLPASASNWGLRSQLFALPLFVTYLFVLTEWRLGLRRPRSDGPSRRVWSRGRRRWRSRAGPSHRLWLLPPLMVVWVNVHGSFVLGGVLVLLTLLAVWARCLVGQPVVVAGRDGVAGGADVRDRADGAGDADADGKRSPPLSELALWGALTAIAALLNPRGPGVLGYVLSLVANPSLQGLISEWLPPSVRTFSGAAFFAYVTVLALVIAYGNRRPDAGDALITVAFFWLALTAERHLIWFALAAAPPLVVHAAGLPRLAALIPRHGSGPRGLGASFLAGVATLVVASSPWLKPLLPLPEGLSPLLAARTPVRAVQVLNADSSPPARLFHSEAYGSYLMWAAPDTKVFIDTRVEFYPLSLVRDYQRLSAGFDAEGLLRAYGVDGLLLDLKRQGGLAAHAMASPRWRVRFRDRHSVYLVRAPEER